jgi:hypothetical protein
MFGAYGGDVQGETPHRTARVVCRCIELLPAEEVLGSTEVLSSVQSETAACPASLTLQHADISWCHDSGGGDGKRSGTY